MFRWHTLSVWTAIVCLGACRTAPASAFDSPVAGKALTAAESSFADAKDSPDSQLSAVLTFQAPSVDPASPMSNMAPMASATDDWRVGNWYFQAEALFLRRDNQLSNQPVVLQSFVNGDPDLVRLTTGNLSSNLGYGQRYLLGRVLKEDAALELVYFGIIDWKASSTVSTGTNDLKLPSDLGQNNTTNDFNGADQMTVSNTCRLNNVEANWVQTLSGTAWNGTSVLAGFRYVSLNETFNIHAVDFTDQGQSDYRIKTTNNLFGAQLGGRVSRRYSQWGWDATGKVGLFGNAARQQQYVYDDNNTVSIRPDVPAVGSTVSASRGTVAFVGDINASLVYQLTNAWALRGGYNVMWIEGAALAGNQLDFTNLIGSGTEINSRSGGLFLHGASMGLEARW